MYGRSAVAGDSSVSARTVYHHSVGTGDRAGDCTSPIYRFRTVYVVVTTATLGLNEPQTRGGRYRHRHENRGSQVREDVKVL
jgi:hypothetical protein